MRLLNPSNCFSGLLVDKLAQKRFEKHQLEKWCNFPAFIPYLDARRRISTYFDAFWRFFLGFATFQSLFFIITGMPFDIFWTILDKFEPFWTNLNHFGQILNHFGQILNHFGQILNHFGQILNHFWPNLEPFWTNFESFWTNCERFLTEWLKFWSQFSRDP